ncbi:MAG: hypothetical protein M3341_07450, partial [Actinomycetota bacterium]|nr:hypothetical protein [Actinomycetota bacterium]
VTKGAVELARRVGVTLYDAQAIRTWIRRIDEKERRENQSSKQERRTVDLDAGSTWRQEDTTMDSGMEKHTISVGTDVYGETVAFTANKLGTAEVNGGNGAPGGLDLTIYCLPDNTYRAPRR